MAEATFAAGRGRCAPARSRTLASYRETVTVALVHLDATDQSERVVNAIRATANDTAEDIAEMEKDHGVC